eukprot:CAMPEP_0197883990 /NCGR_PEP_ID=MMETSP1439-20131203/10611_1 /TAXON_ID=66791 /ORGANISM="Gonyaulax spinifera, Strain CCMP409" /LENGTH=189 /DNA_ID=CAMNT_0043503719 /DNA_START=65 /DNA_END=631 /DNA_ORIENTATION=+
MSLYTDLQCRAWNWKIKKELFAWERDQKRRNDPRAAKRLTMTGSLVLDPPEDRSDVSRPASSHKAHSTSGSSWRGSSRSRGSLASSSGSEAALTSATPFKEHAGAAPALRGLTARGAGRAAARWAQLAECGDRRQEHAVNLFIEAQVGLGPASLRQAVWATAVGGCAQGEKSAFARGEASSEAKRGGAG